MLRPFFSYYGSKYSIVDLYPKPQHEKIIEPFAGSAQYSLRYYNKDIQLYDLDENICMIWDYLINVKESELQNLDTTFDHIDDLVGYTQEQKILLGFWCAKGASRPQNKMTKYAKSSGTADYKQRAIEQVKYIRHWKITKKSYNEIPNDTATWFIDPPYIKGGHKYKESSKNINFDHLSRWCISRKGSYIVCEGSNANWLPFRFLCKARSCANKDYNNNELVFTNIPNQQLSLFEDQS